MQKVIQGIGEIIQGFAQVEENIERNAWQIPKKIQDSWVFMIHITDAIDTGDYLRSVHWHPATTENEMRQFTVDHSENPKVDYPGFVEGGTRYMPPRFPAQRAIEREDFLQTIGSWIEGGFEHAK